MRARRLISLLVMILSLYAGGVFGSVPVAVSPGDETGVALISQECPTFSWSQAEGAVSYRLKIFESIDEGVLPYEEMERTAEPLMSVEIKAPALSWTPSAEDCFETGKKYVWYVGAISGEKYPELVGGWSQGRGFEVDIVASARMREAVKETVNTYLTKEWAGTEIFKEVREVIKSEVLKEIWGGSARAGGITPLALEGSSNTFYGTGAGFSTAGDNDGATFVGANAGYNNTGLYNTFIGRDAGYANTDSVSNTFVGYAAGRQTTNSHNTFVGESAGRFNTTGGSNAFLGMQAGYSNTDGERNTFLGSIAGYANTRGTRNTFLGMQTGWSNTEGSDNTFLGQATGIYNTLGSRNTFVGKGAGLWNTAGSDNVFLGFSAGEFETGSNKLYIANSDTTTPLIYGEFNNNKLIINGTLSIASSREYKQDIDPLKVGKAIGTLQNLKPVEFSYKATPSERHLGFISEEVPESLTTKDRKAVNPMDILAVLTKVVQEQQKTNQEQQSVIKILTEKLAQLEARIEDLRSNGNPMRILSLSEK